MSDDTLDADVAAAITFAPELVNETPIFGAAAREEAETQGRLVHDLGAQAHVRASLLCLAGNICLFCGRSICRNSFGGRNQHRAVCCAFRRND